MIRSSNASRVGDGVRQIIGQEERAFRRAAPHQHAANAGGVGAHGSKCLDSEVSHQGAQIGLAA